MPQRPEQRSGPKNPPADELVGLKVALVHGGKRAEYCLGSFEFILISNMLGL
jgi:hypothetical protein